uniref:Calmodulin-binding domain-containing protein n=1 Tax=Cucumis sativus TaxID=3659 RepID=A0A0A0KSH7_CUCSA
MAEKGDVPVTLETIGTPGTYPRRSSMGCTSYSNSVEKLVPNYLRASTGSCHDFCKYGRNHGFETKSRLPLRKILGRKSLGGGISVDGIVLPERKNTTSTWASADFSSTSRLSETKSRLPLPKNVARKSLDGGKSVDSVILPERKKTTSTWSSTSRLSETKSRQSMTKNGARKSLEGGSSVDCVVFSERKNTTSTTRAKSELSSTSRLHEVDSTTFSKPKLPVESPIFPTPVQREIPNKRKKKLLSSPKQREVLNERKKKLLVEPRTLPTSRSSTKNSLKNLKPEAFTATRRQEDSVVQVFAKAKGRELPEKSDKILKPKSIKVKPLRSAGSLDNSRKKSYSKMGKCLETSKGAAKKVVAASTGSYSSNSIHGAANLTARKHVGNLKGVPLKNRNMIKKSERGQVQSEEVQEKTLQSKEIQEKTLYVIKIENEKIPQQPDQDETNDNMEAVSSLPPESLSPPISPALLPNVEDQDVSEYTESEAENDFYYEGDEIGSSEPEDNITSSEGSENGRSRNHGILPSKEKDPRSTKLSFRRGRVIDIHSESNSPRRLKFRRGRLLGENQKAGDGLRKNFKRGKEVDSETNTTAQETVVLRHQDVQGKKDAQGLFNNVIEETASKLVETRKSKVKALVGAFETVISLQDGKPSLES